VNHADGTASFLAVRRNVLLFSSIRAAFVTSNLRNGPAMVLRDIERLNRRASFGAILAKSRALSDEQFIVLFY